MIVRANFIWSGIWSVNHTWEANPWMLSGLNNNKHSSLYWGSFGKIIVAIETEHYNQLQGLHDWPSYVNYFRGVRSSMAMESHTNGESNIFASGYNGCFCKNEKQNWNIEVILNCIWTGHLKLQRRSPGCLS